MNDEAKLAALGNVGADLRRAIATGIVGQQAVVDALLTAVFADGHVLFVGVPGLAKTLLVSTLARAVGAAFGRIQFTPDLMPSDITGVDVLEEDPETRRRTFRFVQGPVFNQLVLADEINRTPPKTQAALLQAMQERRVTAGGTTHQLPSPFLVFATQNPIEQEGTYPLPEAQQDRFLLSVPVGYPTAAEEAEIVRRTTTGVEPEIPVVLTAAQLAEFQSFLRGLPVPDALVERAVSLVRATRDATAAGGLRWGAGPRASQGLIVAARARAGLAGRAFPTLDDLRAVALSVLRHRVVLDFEAEATGKTVDEVLGAIIARELRA
ncbi:MAG: hypothetical protein RLZZ383_2709 [Pseudomonadota bacterium]|jgi:MoxR-like ATPase